MKKSLVYDIPTRLFHWIFAGLFLNAFFIAKAFDDDSAGFPYHMLMGLILAFVVITRIIWGIVGSRYARFGSFELNPAALIHYFKDLLTSKTRQFAGHNPASSWAAIVMMLLALGLAFTGWQMVNGNNKEFFEDIHEVLANSFIVIVIAHIIGIIVHTIKHKEMIALSMINGEKQSLEESAGIQKSYALVGIIFLVLVMFFSVKLFKGYDVQTGKLEAFGSSVQLGDIEANDGDEDRD